MLAIAMMAGTYVTISKANFQLFVVLAFLAGVFTFIAIAAGAGHSVALRSDGTLRSWGSDDNGQVSGTPTGTFIAVDAAFNHSVAIRPDGTLVTWGNPVIVAYPPPAGSFSAVAATGAHNAAIRR